jgi:hypothetical protein
MISFRDNFFFLKFSILFFIVTIFGYWGIDLNSEELYIAFSFFFLVIVAFITVRASALAFFSSAVNRKYSRLLLDLNRIRLILAIRSRILDLLLQSKKTISARVFKFLSFVTEFLPLLTDLRTKLYLTNANRFFVSLALHVNFFIMSNTRVRRFTGFFENSSRFFPISV